MKCIWCEKEALPKWKDHCDFHQALGTFFQYERSSLWSMDDEMEMFFEKMKKWMDSLSEEVKQGIYDHYWLGNPKS